MILDGAELEAGHELTCEVCIVGAGPAGIAVALELGKRGHDVILLESGGRKFDAAAHDLNRGSVVDLDAHGPLEDYRRRRLGGATTAWGGRSAPFDAIDFEKRDFVPHSGWPIGLDELTPYYVRANALSECGDYDYTTRSLPGTPPFIAGLKSAPELTMEHIYRFSPPTNFGARYEAELQSSSSIRVLLHATALALATNVERNEVERVEIRTGAGRTATIRAKRFVLAGGGLEVTRLLFLSGLGNDHDLLGRFYQCHVTHRVDVELEDPTTLRWDYERTSEGVYCQRTLSIREESQRTRHILNSRLRVEHPEIADPSHKSGALSAVYLAKYALTRQAANPLLADAVNVLNKGVARPVLLEPRAHVENVARDLGGVATLGGRWIRKRMFAKRKLPSVVLKTRSRTYTLRVDAEQAPNPASRVTLGDEQDATGARRLHVDWRATELDAESLVRTTELVDEALKSAGVGRAHADAPAKMVATGGHHLGTTRMANEPSAGVVDANCRVHGVANAYVASGSVFPTCSYANPTLTIIALALRLADHLGRRKDL